MNCEGKVLGGTFFLLYSSIQGSSLNKQRGWSGVNYEKKQLNVQLKAQGIKDKRVLKAFQKVPRHLFVRAEDLDDAYENSPLPIGYGQTISQPFIVALMTEALELDADDKVLEIGTGSGYQTAILAELAHEVYSIEKVPQLAEGAERRLKQLSYRNIQITVGDGTRGWVENSPYNAIMVTAASPKVPPSLWQQLALEGRMVIPVGDMFVQDLLLLRKTEKGRTKISLGGCRFVPLLGEEGWKT